MADLLASAKSSVRGFSQGQKITAKVLKKNDDSLIFDIGGKSEGVVKERAFSEARDFIKGLKEGDEVIASVLIPETREGEIILSLRQAANEALWQRLTQAKDKNAEVVVMGKNANQNGITVDIEGLVGFIPSSQIGKEASKNTQSLIGKYFKAKVLDLNKNENKIVLSEKEVSEEEDIKSYKEALAKVKEGEVYKGEVTTVANFGCFVRLSLTKGKISPEGLVHISELSWSKVEVPRDVVKEGDKVEVLVIGVRDGKLALSIKQALKDPWQDAAKKYTPEDKVKGKVVRVSDYGVFVELEPGVTGLIHLTKIPPGKRMIKGDEVDCYVEEIDTKDKRLSLRLALSEKPVGYK